MCRAKSGAGEGGIVSASNDKLTCARKHNQHSTTPGRHTPTIIG